MRHNVGHKAPPEEPKRGKPSIFKSNVMSLLNESGNMFINLAIPLSTPTYIYCPPHLERTSTFLGKFNIVRASRERSKFVFR